eukprot:scaffold3411_cov82-Cylindrotheca_fusiformis.AAC.3
MKPQNCTHGFAPLNCQTITMLPSIFVLLEAVVCRVFGTFRTCRSDTIAYMDDIRGMSNIQDVLACPVPHRSPDQLVSL